MKKDEVPQDESSLNSSNLPTPAQTGLLSTALNNSNINIKDFLTFEYFASHSNGRAGG